VNCHCVLCLKPIDIVSPRMERIDDSKQQIELLEGKSNWTTWKFRAMILLRGIKKAIYVVEGWLSAPVPLAADATETQSKTFKKEFEVFSTADARDMAVHLSHLKHQFHELNAEFDKNELQRLPDILLIMKILNTLSEQYLPFLTSLKMINKTERTVDRLTSELCMFQQHLQKKDPCQPVEGNEALSVQKTQSFQKYKGKAFTNKKTVKKKDCCFYCKAKGHYISQCVKWIADR